MFTKILSTGLSSNLDFEESIRVKFLNASSLLFSFILYFFIAYHLVSTKKYETAGVLFAISICLGIVFFLHKKEKYQLAKILFFFLLHLVVLTESMFLSPGRGNEYFYLAIIILLLIQVKTTLWLTILIGLNGVLYVLPQLLIVPYPADNYSIVTVLAVFFAIVLSVRFFIIIQNQYKELLRHQNEKLAILNTEKNDLMSIVAHDLKTPLAQIKGLVNILELESSKLSDDQVELLERIKGVTENQHSQITSFLDTKALDDKMAAIDFKEFDLIKKVQSIIDSMNVLAVKKKIKVLVQYDAKKINVFGSEDCIDKIVSNLLSNAIKYSFTSTEIKINVHSDSKQIMIIITDQGQGFKKQDLRNVFVKNQVLSATPTANESSSGVGLYIVKKYVDMMGGWIWLESEEKKGTTFYLKFPKVYAEL